ncbi:MaoC family dehydratase [Promicromonospora sp. Populi]|uniref:MaoC family dehydratase n=1 Tax=Promicromonospora sp. Populi TaxID=3239420 RepID=UPI0034E2DABA
MTAQTSATTVALADLPSLVGTTLGPSSYRAVTQEQVNLFADATDDHQWIHTDPEKAKDGPFGGPIAHGYLTLSLLIPLTEQILEVTGVTTKVNYGLDRARFVSPVRVGARVRLVSVVQDVAEVKGGMQITLDSTVEIEGSERPAVVATTLFRFYA